MDITITNKVMVQGAPEKFLSTVRGRLTFPNPQWLENDKKGYWNGQTPKELKCYEQVDNGLVIPRGFIGHLIKIARDQGVKYHLEDHRRTLTAEMVSEPTKGRPLQVLKIKRTNEINEIRSDNRADARVNSLNSFNSYRDLEKKPDDFEDTGAYCSDCDDDILS
jgi:hypothetical protein